MIKLSNLLKEAMDETSYKKSGLKNPAKADLDKNHDISSYEKKRGKAIEKSMSKTESADDENMIRFGNEVRPLETLPSLGQRDYSAMSGKDRFEPEHDDSVCQSCGAPMMFEDQMCMECGWPMEEEEDHEVFMATNSLRSIAAAVQDLISKMEGGEADIPAWIEDHIARADDLITQASKGFYELGAAGHDDVYDNLEEEGDEVRHYIREKKKPSSGLSKKQKSAIAKKAKSGKDIGKKGKGFEKVAAKAAKEYGSAERGRKVAAAAMWKAAAKRAHK